MTIDEFTNFCLKLRECVELKEPTEKNAELFVSVFNSAIRREYRRGMVEGLKRAANGY